MICEDTQAINSSVDLSGYKGFKILRGRLGVKINLFCRMWLEGSL